MNNWQKFITMKTIDFDLFYFLEDYNKKQIPSHEIMLAMSLFYYLDNKKWFDDLYTELITILAEMIDDAWVNLLRFIVRLNKL